MLDAILLLLTGDNGAPECYASAARIKVLLLLGRIAMHSIRCRLLLVAWSSVYLYIGHNRQLCQNG